MEQSHFEYVMARMTSWFKKKLTEDQLDAWYEKLKHMVPQAFEEIVNEITNGEKFFPTPNLVLTMYGRWAQDNPLAYAQDHPWVPCDECDGKGYIRSWWKSDDIKGYLVDGEPHPYWTMKEKPCGLCTNWKNVFPGKGKYKPRLLWTKAAIVAKGGALEDPDEIKPGAESYNNVGEAADAVGQEMPDFDM